VPSGLLNSIKRQSSRHGEGREKEVDADSKDFKADLEDAEKELAKQETVAS